MDSFRKRSLERQIQKQKGQLTYDLPDPKNGISYLGKQVPNSKRTFRYDLDEEITVPIGGRKVA